MQRRLIPFIALMSIVAAWAMGGSDPFGRIATRIGLHDLAARLLIDPAARGAALYRAGHYDEAATVLADAGPNHAYPLGNAYAKMGDYAEALLAYDRALVREPGHADAHANFALIASLYSGTKLELNSGMAFPDKREGATVAAPEAEGGARASGQGDKASAATDFFKPDLKTGLEQRGVRQPFDDLFIAADERWLITLEDQPGKYLAARLKAEQARRRSLGTAVPEGSDPW